jgi:hypothetical protein
MPTNYTPGAVWNAIIQLLSDGEDLTEINIGRSIKQVADNTQYLQLTKVSKSGDTVTGQLVFSGSGGINMGGIDRAIQSLGTGVTLYPGDAASRQYVDTVLGDFIDNILTSDGRFTFTFSGNTLPTLKIYEWGGHYNSGSTGYFHIPYFGVSKIFDNLTALQWENGTTAFVDGSLVDTGLGYYRVNYKQMNGIAAVGGNLYVYLPSGIGIGGGGGASASADHTSVTLSNNSEVIITSVPGEGRYLRVCGYAISSPLNNSSSTIVNIKENLGGTILHQILVNPGDRTANNLYHSEIELAVNVPIVVQQTNNETIVYVTLFTQAISM